MNMNQGPSTPVYSPDMTIAKKSHQDLLDLLSQLSSKLSGVSRYVDEEFLSSYRVHMISIQQQLKNLKQQQIYEEELLKSDVIVAKLENEKQWFTEECDRLKENLTSIKSDHEHLKSKYSNIKKEKKYMSNILKSLILKNNVLKAEIEFQTSISLSRSTVMNNSQLIPAPLNLQKSSSSLPKKLSINTTGSSTPSISTTPSAPHSNSSRNNSFRGIDNQLVEGTELEDDEAALAEGSHPLAQLSLAEANDEDEGEGDMKVDDDSYADDINNTLDSLSDFNHYSLGEKPQDYTEQEAELFHRSLEEYYSPAKLSSPLLSSSPLPSSQLKKKGASGHKSTSHLLSNDKLFNGRAGPMKGSKSATSLRQTSPSPIRSSSSPVLDRKSIVESSLEDSIRFVFKEVLKRKKESAALANTQTKTVFVSDIDQLGGISQLGTKQLTENDRFAVIVRLLSENPEVMGLVLDRIALNYPHIFAHNSSISEL